MSSFELFKHTFALLAALGCGAFFIFLLIALAWIGRLWLLGVLETRARN